jgi:hypothetical protein
MQTDSAFGREVKIDVAQRHDQEHTRVLGLRAQ